MVRGMALTARRVTIDCADPMGLAKFWTAAGYELRRQQEDRFPVLWKADDRPAEVARLVGLRASVVNEHVEPGLAWMVLAGPGGNQFCVSAHG